MTLTVVIVFAVGILSMSRTSQASSGEPETLSYFARCEKVVKEIEREDYATTVDDSPTRLYSTWMSQECEVRAGPEYVIRKYTFFVNGTFLLLRHHYAEESCSIPTHTVAIRGSVKLLRPSSVVSGATETTFHVDTVNIIPLNRQVAHKFGYRLNLTCGPQPRWRPYVPQLIYEQPRQRSTTPLWQGPIYNSLQARSSTKTRLGVDCLEPFGIEFGELKLLRVQRKTFGDSYYGSRYELFLAGTAPNVHSRWTHKPTSLQPTVMIRADTTKGCPICSSISRSTEYSPPLLHEVAALPALIGGYWLSERCESAEGGVWSKRQFQIHSGDKLWTGRWDYYEDPHCTAFLYAMTAAGSYVQRAGRQRRHEELAVDTFFDYSRNLPDDTARFYIKRSVIDAPGTVRGSLSRNNLDAANKPPKNERRSLGRVKIPAGKVETTRDNGETTRPRRSLPDGVYQFLHDKQSPTIQSRLAAMLRGHQVYETTTRRSSIWNAPSGTTELDLHIAESVLIPGDVAVAARCGAHRADVLLTVWPRNCVPRALEAPSTLGLRAKLGINWNGKYILLLGLRDDNVWEAPLRQCAQIPSYNPVLRAHLRRSVGLRFGLFSSASATRFPAWFLFSQLCLCWLYYLVR